MATLAYHSAGIDNAPPLVLLHSIATSAAMWEPQIPVWSQSFHVIAFDLPGHGDSAPIGGEPGMAALAHAVAENCDTLSLSGALFVGLSLGSMIAQRLAAERPDLVRAAVLSNGVYKMPDEGSRAWLARAASAADRGIEDQVAPTLDRWFTAEFRAASPLTVGRIGNLVRATPIEGYRFAAGALATLDQRDLVTRIGCPTLIVAGEGDMAAPPSAVRALADAVPNSRFVSLPAAHLANVEVPVVYTEVVGAFLLGIDL
jgi:3-oxoadipate enol-lactonase/3-oxoadipate enol-lactonase/4-carboxymuconolactone decarboxylase